MIFNINSTRGHTGSLLVDYNVRKVQRHKGRPQRAWLELMKHDQKAINVILDYNDPNQTMEHLIQMAHDRYA